jgi:hypothetical protein
MRIATHYINEKFTEDSDPIKDMGIGVFYVHNFKSRKQILNWLIYVLPNILETKQIPNDVINSEESRRSEGFFKKEYYTKILRYFDKYILLNGGSRGFDPGLYCKDLYYRLLHMGYPKGIKESLYEKFTEDSDPIHDMNIGLMYQIDEFIEKNDVDNDVQNGLLTRITYLANINDLDNRTKKEWIEYLLREENEDLAECTEYDIAKMEEAGVKFFPNSKNLPDANFGYKVKNGESILNTENWNNFTLYFNPNNELNTKFIEAILSGDSFEYFDYHRDLDLSDILESLSEKEEIKLLDFLKPICLKLSKKVKDIKNIKELFQIIEHTKELRPISDALNIAYEQNLAYSEENAAFKDFVRVIEKTYNLTRINPKGVELEFKISESGLEKFFLANWFEDHRITYYPPRYGWSSDFNVDDYIESIESQL